MRKKKKLALLLILSAILSGGLLTACGDSGAIDIPEDTAGMLYFYAEW